MSTHRSLLHFLSISLVLALLFSGFSLPSAAAQGNAIPLAATTWYVAATGNDSNSCSTPVSPCLTINGAIGKTASGDTIKVTQGVYTGISSNVITIYSTLTLSGGWNPGFTTQAGYSIIDGEKTRAVVGILSLSANATIDHFIIQNGMNSDGFYSGGITNFGVLTLTNSLVRNNTTAGYGGGISGGKITITNSAIYNNKSAFHGGGINTAYALVINNSTISNNSSGASGGGIYIASSGVSTVGASINGSTITGNFAVSGGGFADVGLGFGIRNSIVANNTSGSNSPNCIYYGDGSIGSSGNNIIDDVTGCSITPSVGDKFNVDPQLFPLIYSVGYQPLKSTSPAINAGFACPPTDQRGIARVGVCDLGAYEYTAPIPPAASLGIVKGDEQIAGPDSVFSIPLQVVSLDSQGSPIGGVALNLTAPLGGASGSFDNGSTEVSLLTDSDGFAVATFTANGQQGSYAVVGSTNGFQPISFHLENAAWYVSLSGSDPNDCKTPTTPCATINGVVGKAQAGGTIYATAGIYKGSGSAVVTLNKDMKLSGGWNDSFTIQDGFSTINGEDTRSGILVNQGINATFEKFVVEHGYNYGIFRGGVSNDGILTLNDCEIRYNSSSHFGGGITNRGQLTLNNCNVVHNSGITGGGIYNQGGLSITNGVVAHNSAGQGGGIYNTNLYGGGFASINHTIIESNQANQAGSDGGGINNQGSINIKNTGINNNSAASRGGGIINHGTATLENVSIVGNTAAWQGGGIQTGQSLVLNSATISNNAAMLGGGIFVSPEFGSAHLKNTILANNTSSTSGPDCSGSLLSSGNNIISNMSSCAMTASNGDLLNVNPRLGTLLPSEGYIPLRLNSPAIDAGDDASCPVTDQRGLARPYGSHCDIGAYEAEYILISGNAGIAGATLSYIDQDAPLPFRADSKRNYLVRVPKDWSGTVTPSKIGYTFIPTERTYSHLQSFQTGQDYTAQYDGGADTTGVFRPSNGLLYLKNQNTTGFADIALNYGVGGDYPVVGDWDGDGDATIGIYRNGKFYLRNSNTIGFADMVFPFGQPSDQPIAGDWDADDVDTIGVYRPSNGQFLLRNSNSAGSPEMSFYLGNVGDVGIAGDWDGDGIDTTGVFRPSSGIIFLKNTNTTGFADVALNYGIPSDKPVTGDWNRDGIDTIGVYRNGIFLLRNSNTVGFADIAFGLGIPGDMPIAGNWDGLP